jgi:hypothetical protein
MPKIYMGANQLKKLYLGDTTLKKVYLGSDLVFRVEGQVFRLDSLSSGGTGDTTANKWFVNTSESFTIDASTFSKLVCSYHFKITRSTGDYNGGQAVFLDIQDSATGTWPTERSSTGTYTLLSWAGRGEEERDQTNINLDISTLSGMVTARIRVVVQRSGAVEGHAPKDQNLTITNLIINGKV